MNTILHDEEHPWIVSNDVSVHWLDRAAFAARKSINVYRLPGAICCNAPVLDARGLQNAIASRWRFLEPGGLVLLLQYLQSPRISIVVVVSNFVQFGGHLESRIVQRCLCFLVGPTSCKMRWTEPHPAAFKIAWLPPLYGLSQMFVQILQWLHERHHMG